MRRQNSSIVVDFFSEKGLDKANRTCFAYVPLENMVCYAVAESYDSDNDINSAEMAVDAVLVAFERNPSFRNLKRYIDYANEQLVANSVKNKLETAITVVVSDYTRIKYASCGNIKFFLLSDNAFYAKSETQTYYQFAAREYGLDKAPRSENKNLTQYLGQAAKIKPFVSKKIDLLEESTMLFATCGIWERVDDVEILDAYEESEPDKFLGNVQELYLQTQLKNPAIGSYTLASLFVEKTFKEDVNKKKKRRRYMIIAAIVLLILLIVVAILRIVDSNAIAEIKKLDNEGIRYAKYGNYQMAFEQYDKAKNLTDKLRRDLQYIGEKRALRNDMADKKDLFYGITDGDEQRENGKYSEAKDDYDNAKTASDSISEKPENNPWLSAVIDKLDSRLEQIAIYIWADSLIKDGNLYEADELYSYAKDRYKEAEDTIKQIGDFTLRKELRALIHEMDIKIIDSADTDSLSYVKATMEEAEKNLDYSKAQRYCKYLIEILGDMGSPDSSAQEDMIRIKDKSSWNEEADRYINEAVQAAKQGRYENAVSSYEMALELFGKMGIDIGHAKYRDIYEEKERLKSLAAVASPSESEAPSPSEPDAGSPRNREVRPDNK